MALNRYNIIESTSDQPGPIQETNPLFSPIYGKALFISSIPWRGNTVHSYGQDNPDSGGHKRGNNVANIERNNPAVASSRSHLRPPPVVGGGRRQCREAPPNDEFALFIPLHKFFRDPHYFADTLGVVVIVIVVPRGGTGRAVGDMHRLNLNMVFEKIHVINRF